MHFIYWPFDHFQLTMLMNVTVHSVEFFSASYKTQTQYLIDLVTLFFSDVYLF